MRLLSGMELPGESWRGLKLLSGQNIEFSCRQVDCHDLRLFEKLKYTGDFLKYFGPVGTVLLVHSGSCPDAWLPHEARSAAVAWINVAAYGDGWKAIRPFELGCHVVSDMVD